ncbi:polyamine aminopropyltransferase [Peptococcaceae bacterium]|nr:polyamine aminopropyltransferase [Peptococcaceae bacterium]MCL0062888.1 polyamine aminopropyltransferase [Peptococcaceae bacterium]MCL0100784.1 polyamine aminopropyltransferase [Peptococcaceae bacterium]
MYEDQQKQVFDLWVSEEQMPTMRLSLQALDVLHTEKTEYQHLAIVDTMPFGRVLFLDGIIQTTVKDEFVYHEMITHPALNTHGNPKNVLVIGGGDGGAIREILKYPTVEKATLVEIDEKVVKYSKKYLPEISFALDDPKVEVRFEDGIKHVAGHKGVYDVITVDSPDPIGPAVGLFARDFYQNIFEALTDDGIFVAQTESPWFNRDLIARVYKDISSIFPITRLMLAYIPSYPGGMWSFTMGSRKYDPLDFDESKFPGYKTRYYTPKIHKAAFVLPPFVEELLK